MLRVHCKEIGFTCSFVAVGKTEEAIMWTMIEHLSRDHSVKLEDMTPQIAEKIRSSIHVPEI